MNIVVNYNDENINPVKEIESDNIICPECKENIFLDFKDFKINFSGCKNNHKINDILLNKYKETQKINLSKIVCEICNQNNKNNTYNNEFYRCNKCNKNICPLCKSIHDTSHNLINYDDKNYLCKNHNTAINQYCRKCNENICSLCKNKHKKHDIIDLQNIRINKNDLIKSSKELKCVIDSFQNKIKIIKEIFDKMINVINLYYKINNDIINNYNINKKNYQILKNFSNLKKIINN
jgi:hypothetical protein